MNLWEGGGNSPFGQVRLDSRATNCEATAVRNAIRRPLLLLAAAAACTASRATNPTAAGAPRHLATRADHSVDSVLALLTVDEKIGQLTMAPTEGVQTGPQMPKGGEAQVRDGRVGSFIGVVGAAKTHALQRIAVEEGPHHIPLLFSLDVIHGFRTTFPVPPAVAASFDPELPQRSARTVSIQAAAHGSVLTLPPVGDTERAPAGGAIRSGAVPSPIGPPAPPGIRTWTATDRAIAAGARPTSRQAASTISRRRATPSGRLSVSEYQLFQA